MKTNYNKSEIMKAAWKMYRSTEMSFSECLKAAWSDAFFSFDSLDFGMFDAVGGTKGGFYSNVVKSEANTVAMIISHRYTLGYDTRLINSLI